MAIGKHSVDPYVVDNSKSSKVKCMLERKGMFVGNRP